MLLWKYTIFNGAFLFWMFSNLWNTLDKRIIVVEGLNIISLYRDQRLRSLLKIKKTIRIEKDISTEVSQSSRAKISVYGSLSEIVVKGAEIGSSISVYNLSGASILSSKINSENISISVETGIYIITVGERTFKVAI